MDVKYVYFLIGINTVRLPKVKFDCQKISVNDLEVMMWDDNFEMHFETNDLSVSIAESEEILKMKPILKLVDAIDKSVLEYVDCMKKIRIKQSKKNKKIKIKNRAYWFPDIYADFMPSSNIVYVKASKKIKSFADLTVKEKDKYSDTIDGVDMLLYKDNV